MTFGYYVGVDGYGLAGHAEGGFAPVGLGAAHGHLGGGHAWAWDGWRWWWLYFFGGFVGLGGGLGGGRDRDFGAADVERLREGLDEALRCSGDERELDVVPVGPDGVIDDGPALEDGGVGCVFRKDQAVGGFPDGHFADVADAELALAGAEGVEGEMAEAGGVVGAEEFQVAVELALQAGVEGSDAEGGGELDDADCALGGDDGEVGAFEDGGGVVGVGRGAEALGFEFDRHETAGDLGVAGAAGCAGYLDALAAEGVEELLGGGVVVHGEGQGFELLGEGGGGVVVDSADAAAVFIEDGEGLEDVVELGAGEVDGDVLVVGDLAQVFKVADAVFVEDDLADGEGLGWGGVGGGCVFGAVVGGWSFRRSVGLDGLGDHAGGG